MPFGALSLLQSEQSRSFPLGHHNAAIDRLVALGFADREGLHVLLGFKRIKYFGFSV